MTPGRVVLADHPNARAPRRRQASPPGDFCNRLLPGPPRLLGAFGLILPVIAAISAAIPKISMQVATFSVPVMDVVPKVFPALIQIAISRVVELGMRLEF